MGAMQNDGKRVKEAGDGKRIEKTGMDRGDEPDERKQTRRLRSRLNIGVAFE